MRDDFVGVEFALRGWEYDRLAGGERGHDSPLRGAVHERRQGEDLGARVLGRPLGDLVVGAVTSPVYMFRPPNDVMKMSCWRHSTPFGIPVVPPV